MIDIFRTNGSGFMNNIEYIQGDNGNYVKKVFDTGIFSYPDVVSSFLFVTNGFKLKSGRNRKSTEAENYRKFKDAKIQVPELIEEGKNYVSVEYVAGMRTLSDVLKDEKIEKPQKIVAVRKAAAEIKRIHKAKLSFADAKTENIGYKNDKIILYDFEHEFREGSKEKDISAFAASVAFDAKPSDINDFLKASTEGYENDIVKKMKITPHSYLAFFLEGKLGNLHELRKAVKYGIRNQKG